MSGRGRMRVGQPGVLLRPHGRASMVVPPSGPPIIEQKLAAQHLEIQRLLTENQRFAATHVALRQDLTGVQHELLQLRQIISEKDAKILTLETDVEQARTEVKNINSHRQELLMQVQQMTQDLQRARVENQQFRAENDALRQELQRPRGSYDGSKEENGLFSFSKEVEKLRTATNYSGTSSAPYSTIQQSQQTQQQQPNGSSRAETWTVHYAPNGSLFYYNTVTGVTQWERPAALNNSPQVQMHQPAQLQQFQQIGQALLSPQQAFQLSSQVQPQSVSQSLLSAQASQGVQQYSLQPGGQMLYNPAAANSQVVGGASGSSGNLPSRGQSQQQSTTQNPLSFLPRSSLDHGMASASKPPQVLEGASSTQSPSPAISSPSVSSRPQGAATLLVYGISADYRDMDLADMFKPYGSVLYAKVASAKEMAAGRPCGTVTLDTRRSAEAAISAMNGVSISGRALKVELKREDNESLYHSTSKQQQGGHGRPVKTYQPAAYRPY